MNTTEITLDVRGFLRDGLDPFSKIMEATSGLAEGQRLRLIAPFEPVPLFQVLKRLGFDHSSRNTETAGWEVLISRSSSSTAGADGKGPAANKPSVTIPNAPLNVIELDARGLEPPQPLVTILEALASLPEGVELLARTDRRPIHLYAQIEERGFSASTTEENGSFVTHIRHR